MALRVGQVERRLHVPVEDPAAGPKAACAARRDGAGGALEAVLQTRARCTVRGPADREDDREGAVRTLVEAVGENRARPLRVGAGNREGVGEQCGQLRRRPDAADEDGEPAGENGEAEAEDEPCPALEHTASLTAGLHRATRRRRSHDAAHG